MQDEGDVEQGQTTVNKDHLVDERRGELVPDLTEQGDIDQPQQAGADPGHNGQVEPLTSSGLRHQTKITSSGSFYTTRESRPSARLSQDNKGNYNIEI